MATDEEIESITKKMVDTMYICGYGTEPYHSVIKHKDLREPCKYCGINHNDDVCPTCGAYK